MFTKATAQSDAAVKASFIVAEEIAELQSVSQRGHF